MSAKRNCAGCRREPTCNVKGTTYKCNPMWEDPIKKDVKK